MSAAHSVAVDAIAQRCARLHARLRSISSLKRLRRCLVSKCRAELGVWVSGTDGTRAAKASGVLTCNSIHACPTCARKLRARAMKRVSKALAGGLDAHPCDVWQMISVTLRHHAGMSLRWLRDGEMKAWRRCRQDGRVQRIFKRHVKASIRAFEVTHSFVNGWHPHLHIAILTSGWTDEERETLARVWEESVIWALSHVDADNRKKHAKTSEGYHVKLEERTRALACRPNAEHGIRWSKKTLRRGDEGSKLQAYLTDIGLELSLGATKTTQRTQSRTPWQIAESAVNGDLEDVRLWREYEQGVKGTRCIELDDRAVQYARYMAEEKDRSNVGENSTADELSAAFADADTVGHESVYAVLDPEMMYTVRAYEHIDCRATSLWLEAAANTRGPLTAAAIRESVDACIRGMVSSLARWQLAHKSPHAFGSTSSVFGRGSIAPPSKPALTAATIMPVDGDADDGCRCIAQRFEVGSSHAEQSRSHPCADV